MKEKDTTPTVVREGFNRIERDPRSVAARNAWRLLPWDIVLVFARRPNGAEEWLCRITKREPDGAYLAEVLHGSTHPAVEIGSIVRVEPQHVHVVKVCNNPPGDPQ